jgi:hypothetical protein
MQLVLNWIQGKRGQLKAFVLLVISIVLSFLSDAGAQCDGGKEIKFE